MSQYETHLLGEPFFDRPKLPWRDAKNPLDYYYRVLQYPTMAEPLEEIPETFESAFQGDIEDLEAESFGTGKYRKTITILGSIFGALLLVIGVFREWVQQSMELLFKNASEGVELLFLAGAILVIIVGAVCSVLMKLSQVETRRKLERASGLIQRQRDLLDRRAKQNKDLEKEIDAQNSEIEALRSLEPLKDLEARVNEALASERRVWVRLAVGNKPPIKPLSERKTRFISFLNLKGGVGKTFLAANTAAMVQLKNLRPGRTLLVDLDFQGTLSEGTISNEKLGVLYQGDHTVTSLWTCEGLESTDLKKLTCDMNQCSGVDVLPADNTLDREDYRAQTQHLINARENRFRFRKLLHQDWLYYEYDLVIFDCPPRLTASSINALACSDHIVIPTRLEPYCTRAIANTIKELQRLKACGVTSADILGIIPNEVTIRSGKLGKADQNTYGELRFELAQYLSEEAVFDEEHCAKEFPSGAMPSASDFDVVPSVYSEDVKDGLEPMATEIVRRMEENGTYALKNE